MSGILISGVDPDIGLCEVHGGCGHWQGPPLLKYGLTLALHSHVPAEGLGAGGTPELLSLVFPSGSSVSRTAAPGAGVDSGTNTCGVSGTGWDWVVGAGAEQM